MVNTNYSASASNGVRSVSGEASEASEIGELPIALFNLLEAGGMGVKKFSADGEGFDELIKGLTDKLKDQIFDISSSFSFLETMDFILGSMVDKELANKPPSDGALLALVIHRLCYLEASGGLGGKEFKDFIPGNGRVGWSVAMRKFYFDDNGSLIEMETTFKTCLDSVFKNMSAFRALKDPVLDKVLDYFEAKGKDNIIAGSTPPLPDIDEVLKKIPLELKLYIFHNLTELIDDDLKVGADESMAVLRALLYAESGAEVLEVLVKLDNPYFDGLDTTLPMSSENAAKWFNRAFGDIEVKFELVDNPDGEGQIWLLVSGQDNPEARENARTFLYEMFRDLQLEMTDEAVERLNRLSDQLKMVYDIYKNYHKTMANAASSTARNV